MTEEQAKQKDRKKEMSKMELEGISGSGAPARDRASGIANPIIGEVPAPNYSLTVEDLKGVSGGGAANQTVSSRATNPVSQDVLDHLDPDI
ncbi:hypothetical protein [Synechococcus sp. UW179A]|uniref:hypothetical protein n=1 Tax=Synechococcus sp. UW179A TaxID=2575510 RepID=UPI001481FD5D|nr:hypothetical protein [Synechococcus sp. UW179A]